MESGSHSELRKTGTPRKLEFVGQTIRDNIVSQRESSEDLQSFTPAFR